MSFRKAIEYHKTRRVKNHRCCCAWCTWNRYGRKMKKYEEQLKQEKIEESNK